MRNVTTIGLDIAKNVFQVHGVDADGTAIVRQRLTRSRMLKFFAKLPARQVLELHDAGVVEQHIQRREVSHDSLSERLDRGGVLDIKGHGMDAIAPRRRLLQRLQASASDDDGVATIRSSA